MGIPGTTAAKRYWVGDVEFAEQPSSLQFWPAKSARVSQCVGAVVLALVSLIIGFVIWKNQPLKDLIDGGGARDSVVAGGLFGFGALLLLAVPIYLRGVRTPNVLERGSTILRHGKETMDFQGATGVSVLTEDIDGLVYSVAFVGTKKPARLPLLKFSQKADAERAAARVSAVTALPLV
jgi:hypothetical protein